MLGFFNIFHSVWFIGAGVFLVVNIIICSLNRWKNVKANFSKGCLLKKKIFIITAIILLPIPDVKVILWKPESILRQVLQTKAF